MLLPPRTALPSLRDRAPIGGGLSVSPFCLGLVGDPAVVPAGFDAGINFFFVTADMHWPIYEQTRRGLADLLARGGGVRDDIVVACVAYVTQPVFNTAPFEEVLEELPSLGRLDVLVAGGAYGNEIGGRLPVYQRHKLEQRCGARAIGASFHDREAARAAIGASTFDVAFVRYNPAHAGAREDLFPYVPADRTTRVYAFKTTYGSTTEEKAQQAGLPEGFWIPPIPDYYRFALARPELDGVLCALTKPEHLEALAATLDEGPLSPEEEEHFLLLSELLQPGGANWA